jgi:Cys-rich repeat protein
MLPVRPLVTIVAFTVAWQLFDCGGSTSNGVPGDGGSNAGAACTSDETCARPTPYCDLVSQRCVECLGTANCGRNLSCEPLSHTCVECVADTQCAGATPYCSPAYRCVTCLANGNCPNGQACDTTSYRCVPACTSDMQCAAPLAHCDTTTSRCVMCLTDANCMNQTRSHCSTTHVCVECTTDADCPNGGRCTMGGLCGAAPRDGGFRDVGTRG